MKERLLPAYQLGAIDSDVITSATFPACVLKKLLTRSSAMSVALQPMPVRL
uniref:Uncharacterized protein n=1 Tax=Arundo donax TaxID=35708 RepID=A0A0A9HEU9_ARUDO